MVTGCASRMFTECGNCLLWGGVLACYSLQWKSGAGAKKVWWMTRREWQRPHRIVGMIETVLSPLEV